MSVRDSTPSDELREMVPRARDLVPRHLGRQLAQLPTLHKTYTVKTGSDDANRAWVTFSAQRDIRDIAVDPRHGWAWLATWGGVLCWVPELAVCVRHTSAHGLQGNATRQVVVDRAGRVWASGQTGGLCSLVPAAPDAGPAWSARRDLQSRRIVHLVARAHESGGVLAALRDAAGGCALVEIASPDGPLDILLDEGLAARDIAVCSAQGADIWIGNPWGLHRKTAGRAVQSFRLDNDEQVRALARTRDGRLWVGTPHGLHVLESPERGSLIRHDGWPVDEVIDLAIGPETDRLWVVTTGTVGSIVADEWQAIEAGPSGSLRALAACPGITERAWVGGSDGLWLVSQSGAGPEISVSREDLLSNAVHSLSASDGSVWLGAPRGLFQFTDGTWSADEQQPAHSLRDVQSLSAGRDGRLWVGSWTGITCIGGVDSEPCPPLAGPIVSVAAGGHGSVWAATPDAVYQLRPAGGQWAPVVPPVRQHIDGRLIQTLCHQMSFGRARAPSPTVWVGTSAGLFRFRPDLQVWDQATQWEWAEADRAAALEQVSIEALAVDPVENRLWVGTSDGLFSERPWQLQLAGDISALAFGPSPDRTLWVGTMSGLEQWRVHGAGKQLDGCVARFAAAQNGLADDQVTALAVRTHAQQREVWVGSPTGLSRYRYPA